MASLALHWFRIQKDASGNTVSCTIVEAPEHDGGLIFYKRATSFKQAEQLAQREWERTQVRARRARYAREGRCKCGRMLEASDGKLCQTCLAQNEESRQRRKARERGEDVPTASEVRMERTLARDATRLDIYREIYRYACAARSWSDFLHLMLRKIEDLAAPPAPPPAVPCPSSDEEAAA